MPHDLIWYEGTNAFLSPLCPDAKHPYSAKIQIFAPLSFLLYRRRIPYHGTTLSPKSRNKTSYWVQKFRHENRKPIHIPPLPLPPRYHKKNPFQTFFGYNFHKANTSFRYPKIKYGLYLCMVNKNLIHFNKTQIGLRADLWEMNILYNFIKWRLFCQIPNRTPIYCM